MDKKIIGIGVIGIIGIIIALGLIISGLNVDNTNILKSSELKSFGISPDYSTANYDIADLRYELVLNKDANINKNHLYEKVEYVLDDEKVADFSES